MGNSSLKISGEKGRIETVSCVCIPGNGLSSLLYSNLDCVGWLSIL